MPAAIFYNVNTYHFHSLAPDDVMPLSLALAGDGIDGYNAVSLSTETTDRFQQPFPAVECVLVHPKVVSFHKA